MFNRSDVILPFKCVASDIDATTLVCIGIIQGSGGIGSGAAVETVARLKLKWHYDVIVVVKHEETP